MVIEADCPVRTEAGSAEVTSMVTAYSTTLDTTVAVGEITATVPWNGVWFGSALSEMVAAWPVLTEATSVSETSAVTCSWLRSAMVTKVPLLDELEELELLDPVLV